MANVNLDFDRREHLVNWLIKSGPHMKVQKVPVPTVMPITAAAAVALGKKGPPQMALGPHTPPNAALWLPQPQGVFTSSQTNLNLPLQIFAAPPYAGEGHKPKLRRFNSHDTSANMFSVTEFENNARIAKHHQSKQQQQQLWSAQCDSMNRKNSLNDYYSTSRESSGGHSRTAAVNGGTTVGDEEPIQPAPVQEIMPIDKFLLKSQLPKVVRVFSPNGNNEQGSMNVGKHGNSGTPEGGRLMFIYRHIPNRKIFKAHNTKSSDKRRCLKIPQDLKGYWSLVNEKGQATAAVYSKVIELVRERVYKFLTLENMVAYNESFSEVIPMKSQYVKTTIKAGQTFRILAVFEDDRSRSNNQKTNGNGGQTDREKIRGRYVQILSENRQMFYVPLTTKGKFYEVAVNNSSSNNNQSNRHNSTSGNGVGPVGHNNSNAPAAPAETTTARKPDYVYRISDLVVNNSSLPLNLKLIYAPSFVDLPDYITVEDVLREDILLGCPIPEKENQQRNAPLSLAKLTVFPDIKLQKCLMGHKDDRRQLASPMFQHWIEFCKTHSEVRLQAVEVEIVTQAEVEERRQQHQNTISNSSTASSSNSMIVVSSSTTTSSGAGSSPQPPVANNGNQGKRSKVESLKLLRPLNLGKLLGRDKNYVAHEVEDSIIFLTKSDLEKLEAQKIKKIIRPNETTQEAESVEHLLNGNGVDNPMIRSDKMKVFEQEKRNTGSSWFGERKAKKNKTKSFTSFDVLNRKLTANDRYSDMSKMLQERFGEMSMSTLMQQGNGGGANDNPNGASNKPNGVGGGVNKSSSVTDISARNSNNILTNSRFSMNKTFSLENLNLYDMQPRSRHSFSAATASQTPDLVRIINQTHSKLHNLNSSSMQRSSAASSVENIGQLYPTTSSQCLSMVGGHRDESFISEKLYSEFHVKTKLHSKSSTHLNRWPFQAKQSGSVVTSCSGGGGSGNLKAGGESPMKRTSSIVNITTTTMDVQEAPPIVVPPVPIMPSRITILHNHHHHHRAAREVTKEFINTNTDEFYAEMVCNGQNNAAHHHHQNHTSRTQIVNVL